MTQRELDYIITIAKEKSISKAAEKLYITQPALSLFLTRLEIQLGTVLFDRNGMLPTFSGEKYIQMAEKIHKIYRDFELELCNINKNQSGRLKIGTSPHIGSLILPYVLPDFMKVYPNIEISITEGTSKLLEDLLISNEVDVSLLHLPLINQEINYTLIAKDRYVMAFQRGHHLEAKTYRNGEEKFLYIDPIETKNEKFILAFPYQRVRQIEDKILNIAGISPNIVFTTSSVQTALLSAGTGIGITFLPESYIRLFKCQIVPNYCYIPDFYRPFWNFIVAYPKDSLLSLPKKLFIELVKKAFFK